MSINLGEVLLSRSINQVKSTEVVKVKKTWGTPWVALLIVIRINDCFIIEYFNCYNNS